LKKIIYILSILFFTTSHAYTVEDLEFYTIACERNQYVSCSHLAIIYEEDILVKQDMKKAKKLYIKACGGDDAFACHNVAVIYAKSDNKAIKKISLAFYEKACEGGYAKSCIHLGRLYRDSHTLERNYKKAKEMFAMACEANDYLGCKEERILKEAGY
jgi:TPR repeat protein